MWKPIPGVAYEVSDFGLVRNTKTDRVLAPMWSGNKRKKYATVLLNKKQRKVHHLVLEVFVGPRPKGMLRGELPEDLIFAQKG